MKHTRIRKYLPELLDGVELTTSQIMSELEAKWPKSPPTMNQIGNILAGHSEIEKVGFEVVNTSMGVYHSRQRNCVWSAKTE